MSTFRENYNLAYKWTLNTCSGIDDKGCFDFIDACTKQFKYWDKIESLETV